MAITRREFIQGVGAAGLAAAAGCSATRVEREPALPIPAKPILVVVFIDGGNDWLNMMIPMKGANRAAYEAARPNLKILTSQAYDLGDQDAGIHDDLTGFADLHARGRVAWFPGIGMPKPNLSHFEANDLWGQGRAQPDNTGWLGRYADTAFSANDALRGITVTGDVPLMFRGADKSFVSISGASGFVYPSRLRGGRLGSTFQPDVLEQQWLAAVTAAQAGSPSYDAAKSTGNLFYEAQNRFGADGSLPVRTPQVLYPGDQGYRIAGVSGGLAGRLKLIAQMIAANLGTEVFFARIGGWDTHSNQLRDHPQLMRQLGGAIRSFYEDLASIETPDGNAQARTMIFAYSEFGRRIPENDGGTDHGTAGLAFCVGRSVTGGMYGTYPDLAKPDANKNMVMTLDFRSVYATILDRWLGQSSAMTNQSLGSDYGRLAFL
ncbi:MAG: DUF1501 domain-containing protein [Anaeromyxobacteraceae bacterium]